MRIPACHDTAIQGPPHAAAAYLEWLVAGGETIDPADARRRPWDVPPQLRGSVKAPPRRLDDTGDGELVPFQLVLPASSSAPVAFDLSSLLRAGEVGWRGADIRHAVVSAREVGHGDLRAVADAFTCRRRDVVERAGALATSCFYGQTERDRRAASAQLAALWEREVWESPAAREVRGDIEAGGGELDPAKLRPDLSRVPAEAARRDNRYPGGTVVVLRGSLALRDCTGWFDARQGRWRRPSEARR